MTSAEAIHLSLKDIEEHLSGAVATIELQAKNIQSLIDAVLETRDSVDELKSMFSNYLAATKESRDAADRLRLASASLQSEVREKLKAVR